MKIKEILKALNGNGLTVTDPKLVESALKKIGYSGDSKISSCPDCYGDCQAHPEQCQRVSA